MYDMNFMVHFMAVDFMCTSLFLDFPDVSVVYVCVFSLKCDYLLFLSLLRRYHICNWHIIISNAFIK